MHYQSQDKPIGQSYKLKNKPKNILECGMDSWKLKKGLQGHTYWQYYIASNPLYSQHCAGQVT